MTALPTGDDADVDRFDLPVALHALAFLDEGDEVTVGRRDTDSYCVLPADGAALLRELERGVPPSRAAEWYATTYGQQVDMAEFLAAMEELEFLVVGDAASATDSNRVPWQRLGVAMFSTPAWICYLALLLAAGMAMWRHPDLVPRVQHLIFTEYTTIVIVVITLGQLPFVLLHEAFHALAGRRLGLRSRLRVSRRLFQLVAETNLDGLVTVPRRKRYLPILAGMFADLLIIASLTLVAAMTRHADGAEPLLGRVCLALAFGTVIRFLWQFYLYLETDLYQLGVTILGCVDLQRTSRRMLANRANRLLGRRDRLHDESQWHPRDRAVAPWYSWLLLVGYLFAIGSLLLIVLPLLHALLDGLFNRLVSGHRVSWSDIADSLVSLLFLVGQLSAVTYLAIRDRRRRRLSPAIHVID